MNRAEEIRAEIALIDDRVKILDLELKDVLTDVSTPDVSEDEEETPLTPEGSEHFRIIKNRFLSISELPRRRCDFAKLYQDPEYRKLARRKIKLLRKEVRSANIEGLMQDPLYEEVLRRI